MLVILAPTVSCYLFFISATRTRTRAQWLVESNDVSASVPLPWASTTLPRFSIGNSLRVKHHTRTAWRFPFLPVPPKNHPSSGQGQNLSIVNCFYHISLVSATGENRAGRYPSSNRFREAVEHRDPTARGRFPAAFALILSCSISGQPCFFRRLLNFHALFSRPSTHLTPTLYPPSASKDSLAPAEYLLPVACSRTPDCQTCIPYLDPKLAIGNSSVVDVHPPWLLEYPAGKHATAAHTHRSPIRKGDSPKTLRTVVVEEASRHPKAYRHRLSSPYSTHASCQSVISTVGFSLVPTRTTDPPRPLYWALSSDNT